MSTIKDAFGERYPDGKVSVLRKGGATEAAVRRQAGRAPYLHVATHAFYAAPRPVPAAPAAGTRGLSDDALAARSAAGLVHPGLASGLVLAGANRPPVPGADDGILTALEVAELDLSGVELAVLSACQTKLGKVVGAEDALGLERAFRVAGARAVVASLWEVPDGPTQQLMSEFYRNLWRRSCPGWRHSGRPRSPCWPRARGPRPRTPRPARPAGRRRWNGRRSS